MPRLPRKKSESGIYHIMLRGINQQTIFEDYEDNYKFLEILKKYKAISEYKVFAYCLMSNHAHLLIKVEKEDLDLIMKRIAGSYVYWYNWKYYRKGHLFQDRFKSEPVNDDSQLLTVIRYIHQNPLKAGLTQNIADYPFSSYNDYIEEKNNITDFSFVLSMIKKEDFINFSNEKNNDNGLEIENKHFRLNDNDAKKIINRISGCDNTKQFSELSEDKRNYFIKILKENGLSIRQISRLTGLSFATVRKI